MSEPLNLSEKEELEALRREKEMREKGGMRLAVGKKGGVSLYGLGRFPVTLYKEQWLRVLDYAETIREFITAHETELKSKDQGDAD